MAQQLRGIDAAFLAFESTTSHLQGVGVVRLAPGATTLGLPELIDLVRQRLDRLELLRHRPVTVPGGLDRPYWVDEVPDLAHHVHEHHLTEPDEVAFEQFCAERARSKLDPSRPMWEFWLVHGLAGDAQALVLKVHHSLCDGIGSLAIVGALLDPDPDPDADRDDPDRSATGVPTEEPAAEPAPSAPWLLARAAVNAVRRPIAALTAGVGLAGSAWRLRVALGASAASGPAAPLATPRLAMDGPITGDRVVALRDLPLEPVKALAHRAGVHVNDVILAVLTGALRQWLIARDDLPDRALVAAVPVSTRTPDQLTAPGNHVSALFVHLPVHLEDPRQRLARTAEVADTGKALHTAVGAERLEQLTALAFPLALALPVELYQRAGAAALHPAPVNLIVSNVAGPPFDLFLAGRPADAFYALGPILDGVALNITAISFHGKLGIGYLACPDRVEDLSLLADAQQDAFDELVAAYPTEATHP